MIRRIALAALMAAVAAGTATADWKYLSVGAKLGYAFGKQGGFTWGGEASYIWFRDIDDPPRGIVFDLDGNGRMTKLHTGFEVVSFAGLEAGPTVVFEDDGTRAGLTLTSFAWAVVAMPYYSHTFVPGPDIPEAGVYIKYPIEVERGDPIVLW